MSVSDLFILVYYLLVWIIIQYNAISCDVLIYRYNVYATLIYQYIIMRVLDATHRVNLVCYQKDRVGRLYLVVESSTLLLCTYPCFY